MVTLVATPRPTVCAPVAPEARPEGSAARTLAHLYLRYVSAHWRGDAVGPAFARQLDRFWAPSMPPAPPALPDAVSPHGGGGLGIRWYEAPAEILGYVARASGGYRVPIAALERLALTLDLKTPATAGREQPEPPATVAAGTRMDGVAARWIA